MDYVHPVEVKHMIRARQNKAAHVGVVMKVLKILEVLHNNPSGLQLKEIASQTAICCEFQNRPSTGALIHADCD
jgi:hypothetical protein